MQQCNCDNRSSSSLEIWSSSSRRVIGVLNDYQLEIFPIVRSTQEFIALELLTRKSIGGGVRRLHLHNAGSIIWVLIWVCLRYQGGVLSREDQPLKDWLNGWLRVCVIGCHK
ncbi:hypothetical protein EDB19DRAFT_1714259 [Suillus lakei]|nr:hypothetical protein EDB19DRAFT_1714259 [Suillus lakei]